MNNPRFKRTVVTVGSNMNLVNSDAINASMDISRVQLNNKNGQSLIAKRVEAGDGEEYFELSMTNSVCLVAEEMFLSYDELVALALMFNVFSESQYNHRKEIKDAQKESNTD